MRLRLAERLIVGVGRRHPVGLKSSLCGGFVKVHQHISALTRCAMFVHAKPNSVLFSDEAGADVIAESAGPKIITQLIAETQHFSDIWPKFGSLRQRRVVVVDGETHPLPAPKTVVDAMEIEPVDEYPKENLRKCVLHDVCVLEVVEPRFGAVYMSEE